MRLRRFLPVVTFLALPFSLALASQNKETETKPPVFRTNTRAVVVDIVVDQG